MRLTRIALSALLIAGIALPTVVTTDASAKRSNAYWRALQRQYTARRVYNPYSAAQQQAQLNAYYAEKNALVNQVNAAISAGQITAAEGNQILVRGRW